MALYVIVAAIVALWTAAFAILRPWAGPLAIVVFIGMLAFTLLAVNQFAVLRERKRRERLLVPLTPEEVERRILNWLYRAKFTVRDDRQGKVHFQILATDQERLKATILQLPNDPYVTITSKFNAPKDEEGLRVMREIVEAQDSTFPEDLSIELAQLGVGYGVTGSPPEITIEHKFLFGEPMTELGFLQHLWLVRRALDLVRNLLRRAAKKAGYRLVLADG